MEQKAEKKRLYESSPCIIQVENFLNKDDFSNFQKLKKTLSSQICRNRRYKRIESFNEILLAIHGFINREKNDAWKRSLVCGICWYQNYVCTNIKQMSYLLDKCKSSINGSFQRISLIVIPSRKQTSDIMIDAIPYLKNHQELLKMWSVRQYIPQPQAFITSIPMTIHVHEIIYPVNNTIVQ